jgi:hypothetical protein
MVSGTAKHWVVSIWPLAALTALACDRPEQALRESRQFVQQAEDQRLAPVGSSVDDAYGASIAVRGDRLVVGAPNDATDAGDYAGSIYAYARDAATFKWGNERQLFPTDASAGEFFGQSLAITHTQLAVGTNSSGPVYVYTPTPESWGNEQKIGSPGVPNDGFGVALALDGTTLLVGANVDSTGVGAAYVFTLEGEIWTKQARLAASDGAELDFFGSAVALSGDTAVVGAPGRDEPGVAEAGAAYVFVRSGGAWTEQQRLVAAGVAIGANAGQSVSIDGDTLAIGAPNDAGSTGAIYVWTRDAGVWSERTKLRGAAGGDQLGSAIALLGDTLLGAAGFAHDVRGTAFLFEGSGGAWSEVVELVASDGAADSEFGHAVSLDAETLAVAALRSSQDSGAAYLISREKTGDQDGGGGAGGAAQEQPVDEPPVDEPVEDPPVVDEPAVEQPPTEEAPVDEPSTGTGAGNANHARAESSGCSYLTGRSDFTALGCSFLVIYFISSRKRRRCDGQSRYVSLG